MTDQGDWRERAHEAEQAVVRHALELAGPWPASTTLRGQNVEVLDVDRYEGYGVVLSAIERSVVHRGDPALMAHVFRRDEGWQSLCAGGGGSPDHDPLLERRQWTDPTQVIVRRGSGRCRPGPGQRGQTVCYAEVICSSAVASAVVDRPADRRLVDVSQGPGWIVIVWPEGSEPRVTAFGAAGEDLDYLDPRLFADG